MSAEEHRARLNQQFEGKKGGEKEAAPGQNADPKESAQQEKPVAESQSRTHTEEKAKPLETKAAPKEASAKGEADGKAATGKGGEAAGYTAEAISMDGADQGSIVQQLGQSKPTVMVSSFGNTGPAITSARQQEHRQAAEQLPEIQQPTGLGADDKERDRIESEVEQESEPTLQIEGKGPEQQVETAVESPTAPPPSDQMRTPPTERIANPEGLGSAIGSIPNVDPALQKSPGIAPQVQLTGEADPGQNDTAQAEAERAQIEARGKADLEIQRDFGENDIYPRLEPEAMTPENGLDSPPDWSAGTYQLPEMDAQTAQMLDAGIIQHKQGEIDAELAKQTAGQQAYMDGVATEREQGMADIDAENERVRLEQIKEQEKGRKAIDDHRAEWKKENEAVSKEFEGKSAEKRGEIEGQIEARVQETDSEIEAKYQQAEQDAIAKEEESKKDIEEEKRKAEREKENQSFWDRVASAVSDFFNALKEAVTAIFDALREAVTAIIEAAKEAAAALIDMARDAIKGLIDVFAEALKSFVQFALAAFPEIADKFCEWIDAAAEAAKTAVDALAEALKTAVQFLLDAIGAAINALLSVYEFLINAILSAIEAYILFYLMIMEGIANLVMAAIGMPDFFMGQASEELLGQDVTEPLDNEYLPGEAGVAVVPMDLGGALEGVLPLMEMDEAAMSLLGQQSYSESDFEVPVADGLAFDPELNAQLVAAGDGEFNLGEFKDAGHGIDALKAEMGYGPSSMSSPDTTSPTLSTPSAPVVSTGNRDRFTPDAAGKVGPFSVGERTKFVVNQMLDGIKQWLSDNWPALLAALIGIIGGAILANILTGGAIMAALPIVMQLVSAYFAAEAILKMTGYIGGYLVKAFPGDVLGGSKSLARGLAIGAIELVFALAFGGKAAFKAVKGAVKTVAQQGLKGATKTGAKLARESLQQGAKQMGKQTKHLSKVVRGGVKTAGKNVVKGGKFVLQGLKKGALKGARTLDDLGKRLGKFFKFDGFKLVVKGRKWKLLGRMNPWVLLANGEVIEVDDAQIIRGKKKYNQDITINRGNGPESATYLNNAKYADHLSPADARLIPRYEALARNKQLADEVLRSMEAQGMQFTRRQKKAMLERLKAVQKHVFETEHANMVVRGEITPGRFTPMESMADLFEQARTGFKSADDFEDFKALFAHEYIESSHMRRGMKYRSTNADAEFTRGDFGGHDLSPVTRPGESYSHWTGIDDQIAGLRIADDLHNLDEVAEASYRRGQQLASGTTDEIVEASLTRFKKDLQRQLGKEAAEEITQELQRVQRALQRAPAKFDEIFTEVNYIRNELRVEFLRAKRALAVLNEPGLLEEVKRISMGMGGSQKNFKKFLDSLKLIEDFKIVVKQLTKTYRNEAGIEMYSRLSHSASYITELVSKMNRLI